MLKEVALILAVILSACLAHDWINWQKEISKPAPAPVAYEVKTLTGDCDLVGSIGNHCLRIIPIYGEEDDSRIVHPLDATSANQDVKTNANP